MEQNKICVFVYDWVDRTISENEIFGNIDLYNEKRYFKMSQLNGSEKKDLPLKYKINGWKIKFKSIFK
tara:strand:- start:307 stop:510 length:204 start_codon:yes stop_codon:yes gene_type:complete